VPGLMRSLAKRECLRVHSYPDAIMQFEHKFTEHGSSSAPAISAFRADLPGARSHNLREIKEGTGFSILKTRERVMLPSQP
jgi:hypothetical protein